MSALADQKTKYLWSCNFSNKSITQNISPRRTIPFEAIEFEPNECPFDSDSSAEELNFDTDSDSADGNTEEWDRLHDLPEPAMDPHYHSTSPSFDVSRDRSLSSSASGLVTSAAASVASALWSWKR